MSLFSSANDTRREGYTLLLQRISWFLVSVLLSVSTVVNANQTVFTAQTPALADASDGGTSYELGMKFQSAADGHIEAIRYYKSPSEAGSHQGRIWSSAGVLLTSVAFSNETASGWQEQPLDTPLNIQANTTYIVTVNTNGHFAFTNSGLATAVTNGDLSSVADGNNGVFGSPGVFPTNSYQNSNYFRDVLFVAGPTISRISGDNQTGEVGAVLPDPLVIAVLDASGDPQPGTTVDFTITSGDGSVSPASVVTDTNGQADTTLTLGSLAGTNTVSASATGIGTVTFAATATLPAAPATQIVLTPASTGTNLHTLVNYQATIQDQFGTPVTTATDPVTFSATGVTGTFSPSATVTPTNGIAAVTFTPTSSGTATVTASASGLASGTATLTVGTNPDQTVFTDQVPSAPNASDGSTSYELGMKFQSAANGHIKAIRYYKSPSDTGPHEGRIWSSAGVLLASVTFSNETTSGWQEQPLDTPLNIQPNTSYVVSVNINSHYAFTQSGLATATVSGDLSSVADGNNGVFGSPGAFPGSSWNNSNYFRDIVFSAGPAMAKASGDNQSGEVGTPLAQPLVIEVRDANGNPLPGTTVDFTATSGGGSVSPASAVTDATGQAGTTLTLGPTAGVNSVRASAGAIGNIDFTATGVVPSDPGTTLVLTPLDSSGGIGTAINFTASILNASGNVVTTATNAVSFSATGVTGTFSPGETVTPVNGIASVSFTPSSAGPATISVSSPGLTGADTGLTVIDPVISIVSGNNQTGEVGTTLPQPLVIEVTDDSTDNPVTGTPVSFAVTTGNGSLTPSGTVTDATGRVSSILTLGSTTGTNEVTATAQGLGSVAFTTTATAAAAVTLSLSPTDASTLINTPVAYQATMLDEFGNVVTSATATVNFSSTGVTGNFEPAATASLTNGIALVTFTPTSTGTATITASTNGLTGDTTSLSVTDQPDQTVFSTQTPALADASDGGTSYELGMKFQSVTDGYIKGIRYYKSPSEAGAHQGRIWSSAGVLLASVAFSNETTSGWQEQPLDTPLNIQANTTYVVSVNTNSHFAFTNSGLATAITNGDLSSIADGNNGVFGSPGVFPTSSFQNSNYFRDVLFVAGPIGSVIHGISGNNQVGELGSTLPDALVIQVQDANGDPLAGTPVDFTVTSGGGSVSPASAVTDANGQASTSFTLGPLAGVHTVEASAGNIGSVGFAATTSNAITVENQKPGTTAWEIINPVTAAAPEIEGYASATSVNVGGTLPLKVSLAQPGQYSIDVYRLGYYGGLGGRLMSSIGPLSGNTQSPCLVTEPTTRLIECSWTTSHFLQIGSDWTSGMYVANLTESATGKQSQIWFVVRDDGSTADILFQNSFTTFLAYNHYGTEERHSLYGFNSTGGQRAFKVSFDRPLGQVTTDPNRYDNMLNYEYPMARWLESQGYDVTYVTNMDIHADPNRLSQHRIFLSAGHDEYWSQAMRDNVEQARDAGTNLAFFSANTAYWRVRFEPSGGGAPDRVMVCYKDPAANDPIAPTYLWRGLENNRPENALIGVMYTGDDTNSLYGGYDHIVANSTDPYYDFTGLNDGDALTGLVGFEWDAVVSNGFTPAGLVVLSQSIVTPANVAPELPPGTDTTVSNAVRYTAASGAKVFATGSIQWMWGLDSTGVGGTLGPRVNPGTQQFAVNVLLDIGARPATPNLTLTIP